MLQKVLQNEQCVYVGCLATTGCQNSLNPLGIDCLWTGHPSNSVGTASSPCTEAAAAAQGLNPLWPFYHMSPLSLFQFPVSFELSFQTKPWKAKIIIIKKIAQVWTNTVLPKYIPLFCDFDNGQNTHCEESKVIVHHYCTFIISY